MKKLLFILAFIPVFAAGQVINTTGIVRVSSAPTHAPTAQGAKVAIDTTSGLWYEYEPASASWREMGFRVQLTYETGAPNYTPGKQRGRVAVNLGDSLYVYQSGEWSLVSGGGGGGADDWGTQVVESGFGLSGTGVTGDELEADTSAVATVYALQDSASDIRADFPDVSGFATSQMLDDTAAAIRGDFPTDTQLSEEQVEDYVGGMVTGNTETLIIVTYQDADGTIDFEVEPNLSNYTNDAGFLTSEVDGSVTNEIQTVDTLVLTGTTLGVSLSQDGVPQKTVDLAGLQDGTGTDDQTVDTFAIVSNQLRISLEGDNEPFQSVDLSAYLDNTDNQTLSFDGANISISGGNSIDISGIDTNTDEQDLSVGGSGPAYTIDISGGDDVTIEAAGIAALSEPSANVLRITATEVDGSVTNEIQAVDTFALSGTTVSLSLSQDGVPVATLDLASLQDGTGTDDQTLSWSSPNLSIESGNSVDLSALLDNTDDQKIDTFAIVSNTLRLSIESDAEPFKSVDLSPYLDNTDNQVVSLDSAGSWYTLTLEDGGSVSFTKDTDTQLSEEQVEDYVGGMVTGNTETLITVTYQDADGTIDFEVEPNLSNYTNDAGFLTAEVDGSVTNELQDLTIGGSGPAYTIDISDGDDVTIEAAGIAALSEPSANVLRITATEVDGSVTNEIQTVDTFTIVSNTLRLSLENDAEPFVSVDLSPYLDNTDNQQLSLDSVGRYFTLTLEDGGSVTWQDQTAAVTEEEVEDYVGGMVTGNTETLITVTYEDADGTLDFVVEDDLSLYDNTTSGFITTPDGVNPAGSETIENTNFTASFGEVHLVDCSGGTIVVTPPSTPAINNRFAISDAKANAETNNITIDFDTANQKLYGVEQNYIINVDGGYVEFIYVGATTGWIATKG